MTGNNECREVYEYAKRFLLKEMGRPDAHIILDSYLSMPDKSGEPIAIGRVFEGLIGSAQNANMKASVIGKAIGGVNTLAPILFDFDPVRVESEYGGDSAKLLDRIIKVLQPRGKVRREPRSLWPKYSITILATAAFLARFRDGDDFSRWANSMYKDPRSAAALPLVLSLEIEGIGYVLACDFLKELGFINYGKPDVHVKQIFVGLSLCNEGDSNYQFQKTIQQISEASGVSAYAVDKLFWLIGSGKFYNHSDQIHLGSMKRKFIEKYLASDQN